jgi:hypothetical protein
MMDSPCGNNPAVKRDPAATVAASHDAAGSCSNMYAIFLSPRTAAPISTKHQRSRGGSRPEDAFAVHYKRHICPRE